MNEKLYNALYTGFFILFPLAGFFAHKAVLPILAVLGLLTVILRFKETLKVVTESRLVLSVLAIGALGIGSAFWAPDSLFVFRKGIEICAILFFGVVAVIGVNYTSPRVSLLPYFTLALGLLTVIEFLFGYPLYSAMNKLDGDIAFAKDELNYSILFLSVLIFPVTFLVREKFGKSAAALCFILMGILICSSVNIAAVFGLMGGMLVYLLTKLSRKLALYAVFTSLIIGLWAAPFVVQTAFAMKPEIIMTWKKAHAGHRLEIWDTLSKKALEQPLTGFGLEASKKTGGLNYSKIVSKFDFVTHPHNFMIQVWLDLGLPGLALFTAFFILLLKGFKQGISEKTFPVRLATFVAVLSSALFSYGLWQGWWLAFMLAVALLLVALQNRPKEVHS